MSPKADITIGANDNLHRHRTPKLKDSNDAQPLKKSSMTIEGFTDTEKCMLNFVGVEESVHSTNRARIGRYGIFCLTPELPLRAL